MKKILGLAIAALIVIAMVAAGTFAYFQDRQTSASNVFSAGTLDLQSSPDGITFGDNTVDATWGDGSTLLYPSDTASIDATLSLKNAGSLDSDHVEIKFAQTDSTTRPLAITVSPSPVAAALDTELVVTSLNYGTSDILAAVTSYFDATANGGNDDGKLQLCELNGKVLKASTSGALDPIAHGDIVAFEMAVQLPSSADNAVQGASVTYTVTFAMFQDASQHLT